MSSVVIKNVSTKEVKGIKLNWYLFHDPDSKREVKKGQTRLISVGLLGISESKTIETEIPEFDEMFGSLAKDGYIEGKYFLEVTVGRVDYADGTSWTRKAPGLSDGARTENPRLLTLVDLQKNDGTQ